MFSFSLVAAVIALSAISTSARVTPRHRILPRVNTPSTYDTAILEDYFTYHARYLALGCQYNHGNDFFDACCHPLLVSCAVLHVPRCWIKLLMMRHVAKRNFERPRGPLHSRP